jgi:hypothetical protein
MTNEVLINLPVLARRLAIRRDWFSSRDALLAEARSVERIASKAEYERFGRVLASLSNMISTVETMRLRLSAPFLQAAKTIKAASDSAKAPLEAAREVLRRKLSTYAESERRRRENARRKAWRVRETALDDYKKLEKIACVEFGSRSEVYNPPLPPEPPKKEAPYLKAESVAVRSRLVYEISEPEKLPREMLAPDKAKIAAWLELNRESLREALKADPAYSPMPGLRFKLVAEVVPR